MPELPEVETVRCQLERRLVGMRFQSVEKTEPTMLRDCEAVQVVSGLPGRRIVAIDRVGKFIMG